MGGIGKSQTTLSYAESARETYKDYLFVNASSKKSLLTSFGNVANIIKLHRRELVTDKMEEQDVGSAVNAIKFWLSTRKSRWLLTFDNVDDPNEIGLDWYLPRLGNRDIIVTSRRKDSGLVGPGTKVVPMLEIETQEAESLLLRLARSVLENSDEQISSQGNFCFEYGYDYSDLGIRKKPDDR